MSDVIRPSFENRKAIYIQAFETWTELSRHTSASPDSLWSFCRFRDNISLHPSFHPHVETHPGLVAGGLSVGGLSTWQCCKNEGSFDIPPFTQHFEFPVSIRKPSRLTVLPPVSPRFQDQSDPGINHTSILVPAWAYILSSRWSEILPGTESVRYRATFAENFKEHGNGIGHLKTEARLPHDATPEEARWWAAVLAPGRGWEVLASENGNYVHAPWSVLLPRPGLFALHFDEKLAAVVHEDSISPASAADALRYLAGYCTFHGAWRQSRRALAAALLLPHTNYFSRKATLPSWTPERDAVPQSHPESTEKLDDLASQCIGINQPEDLDRLLTLSCNPLGIESLLHSVFYEPGIPSNLCGSWLQGTFAVIDALANDTESLALTLMARNPHIGFLWLGAITLGLQKSVFEGPRLGASEIELHAASWTGTIQSFIQDPVSGPLSGWTSRGDECRLLYLTQEKWHTSVPPFPWVPFGSVGMQSVNIEVQEHYGCTGHGLYYAGWKWDCAGEIDQQVIPPASPTTTLPAPVPVENTPRQMKEGERGPRREEGLTIEVPYEKANHEDEEYASQTATSNNIYWLRATDGYLVSERGIREHDWIAASESELASNDMERSCNGQRRTKSRVGRDLGSWFAGQMRRRTRAESM